MSLVIVDDRDSSVQYPSNGNWSKVGSAPDFKGTSSRPMDSTATFEFSFTGTSIEVFGVAQALDPNTQPSQISFSIDGGTSTKYTAPGDINHDIYHQSFFKAPGLTDATHKLTMASDNVNVSKVYIDYMVYTSTSNTVVDGNTNYFVDDRDPSIKYTGQWTPSASDQTFNGTLSTTSSFGNVISYNFTGSGIALYGRLDQSSTMPVVTYTIDGTTSTTLGYQYPKMSTTYNNQLFVKNGLDANVNHQLEVKAENSGQFWFDYILVTPKGKLAESPQGTPTSAPTSPGSSGASPSRKSNTATIAGGIVGAVTALLLIGGLVFFLLRRRRNFERKHVRNITPLLDAPATAPSLYSGSNITSSSQAYSAYPPSTTTGNVTEMTFTSMNDYLSDPGQGRYELNNPPAYSDVESGSSTAGQSRLDPPAQTTNYYTRGKR